MAGDDTRQFRLGLLRQRLLPKRADPVAGAFLGTIVLGALVATPVLVGALIVWTVRRAAGRPSSPNNPEVGDEFSSRFHELEESILDGDGTIGPKGGRRSSRRRRSSKPSS